jgi:hypothetical protein
MARIYRPCSAGVSENTWSHTVVGRNILSDRAILLKRAYCWTETVSPFGYLFAHGGERSLDYDLDPLRLSPHWGNNKVDLSVEIAGIKIRMGVSPRC